VGLVGNNDLAQKVLVGDALLTGGGAKPVLRATALGGQMPHNREGLFRLSCGAIVDEGSDGKRMRSGHRLSFFCKTKKASCRYIRGQGRLSIIR
jgi:hypothetical protein